MSRIERIFSDLRAHGRAALMPFVTAGYPSLNVTREVLPALERAGASIVEIGFPFSDPIADGPVIAASMHEALARGVTPREIFECVREARPRTKLGLVAMVSMSIVHRIGPPEFVHRAAEAGFDGLIVPDVDVDDARTLVALADERELSFSMLIAPTTLPDRLEMLLKLCRGFVYVLARVGITGESAAALDIGPRIAQLRAIIDLPLAVGFGISTPEHVRAATAAGGADAAIVGSALVRAMGSGGEAGDPVLAASELVGKLSSALATRSPEKASPA